MSIEDQVEPFEFLSSRGAPVNDLLSLDPERAKQITQDIIVAEGRSRSRVRVRKIENDDVVVDDGTPSDALKETSQFNILSPDDDYLPPQKFAEPKPFTMPAYENTAKSWPSAGTTDDRGVNFTARTIDLNRNEEAQREQAVQEAEALKPENLIPNKLEELRKLAAAPMDRLAGEGIGTVAAMPWQLLAAAQAPGAWVTGQLTGDKRAGSNTVGTAMMLAEEAKRQGKELFGVTNDPTNPIDRFAGVVGRNITPMGRMTGAATAAMIPLNSGAQIPIDSLGGPTKINEGEMQTIGMMAATSIGMMFAPSLYQKFKMGYFPSLTKFKDIKNAAPGTKGISNLGDLARTYDDVNAGVLRLATRTGMHPNVLDDIEKTFTIQTRSAATQLANSAIQVGRLETPSFTFNVRTPLSQIAKAEDAQVTAYLHLRDTMDDLNILASKPGAFSAEGQVDAWVKNTKVEGGIGSLTVRGYTVTTALQAISDMERANPGLKGISKAYRDNLNEIRRFESVGEYATLSKTDLNELNVARPNYVPFQGERVLGEAVERPQATSTMAQTQQDLLRKRLENEAVGKYIDGMRKVDESLFVPVTAEELKLNPHWKDNVVTMYRRGNKEMYTTDPFIADVLKMDPYYFTGTASQVWFGSKRLVEMGATGEFAPWFSATSALRSWQIGKFTTPDGLKSPTFLGSMYAVPQQLIPQLSKTIAQSLDRGSAGWLTSVIGDSGVNALSTRLSQVYANSFFAEMSAHGSVQGSIMQQQAKALGKLSSAIEVAEPHAKALLEGYRSLLSSVHNAPAFNFASKNRGAMEASELAATARNLTGDPRIGGQYYNRDGSPIRFQPDGFIQSLMKQKVVQPYGQLSEFGRTAIPWFNATEQGIKRIGEAYLTDPTKFVGRAWLYQGLPAASAYLMAREFGKDPNGVEYVDYMMNRRSEYMRTMNLYIPIPGKPAEEGIELPRFHEITPMGRMMEHSLDHLLRSNVFTEKEDFKATLNSFLNVAVIPPMPPLISAGAATQGVTMPQSMFSAGPGGDAYVARNDPYSQTGSNIPSNLEKTIRSLGTGIAGVVLDGYAAYHQTPEGFADGLKNAGKQMGKGVIARTPLVRDLANERFGVSGNTRINEELFAKQHSIDALTRFYSTWTKGTTNKQGEVTRAPGDIDVKPKSRAGGEIAMDKLGEGWPLPSQRAGITQPTPTNPLYNKFMEDVYNKFRHDVPSTGGIGFRSLWSQYGDASVMLRDLRNVNEGNMQVWKKQLEGRPEQVAYLKAHNVDMNNPKMVKNFYEKKRQDAARIILSTVRDVEKEYSEQLGKPFKIEMLDPYGKGYDPNAEDKSNWIVPLNPLSEE